MRMKKHVLRLWTVVWLLMALLPGAALALASPGGVPVVPNSSAALTTQIVYGGHSWYVIDTTGGHWYLFCTDIVRGDRYGLAESTNRHPYSGTPYGAGTDYTGSNLESMMKKVFQMDFTPAEQAAAVVRNLDGTTDAVPPKGALWPLSKAEADALYSQNNDLRKASTEDGVGDHWWMRSASGSYVWFADGSGDYYAQYTLPSDGSFGVRPGMWLDESKILLVSDAAGGKPSPAQDGALAAVSAPASNRYKLTVYGRHLDGLSATATEIPGGKLSIAYQGPSVFGGSIYLSALVKNAGGEITHYGRIKAIATPADCSGTASLSLPAGYAVVSDTVELFFEDYQGDEKTDVAGRSVAPQWFAPVTGVTLKPGRLSLSMAEPLSAVLTAAVIPADATDKTILWHSSDASVASVDAGGLVTAHSAGTATITAASPSGPSAACLVTVLGVSPVPQTGDAANPGLWLCGACLAGLAGAWALCRRRRADG